MATNGPPSTARGGTVAGSSSLRQPLLDDGQPHSFGSTEATAHDSALSPEADPSAALETTAAACEEEECEDNPNLVPADPQAILAAAADRAPPKARWMRRAERCVRGFERRKAKQLRRKDWGVCSLSFPNPSQERTFQYYSAQLRERNMRGCMLLLAFAYCLYATLEWRDAVGYSLSISRGTYVAAILALFIWSYAKPRVFRLWLQEWTLTFCAVTALNIIVEAVLLRAVYSPFVVIILLLFLLSSSVLVRLRFAYTSFLCWSSVLLYDLICLVMFREGDNYLSATNGHKGASATEVAKWLTWYNAVLIFTVLVVQKIAHRVEVQTRYEFLTNQLMTDKRIRARRARRALREAQRMQQQYAGGGVIAAPDDGADDTDATTVVPMASLDGEEESKTGATVATGESAGGADAVAVRDSPSSRRFQGSVSGTRPVLAPRYDPGTTTAAAAAEGGDEDWSDYSDSEEDDDEDDLGDDEIDDVLLGLGAEGGGAGAGGDEASAAGALDDATGSQLLHKLNATLQRTLHDLMFTPATVRQRARIESAEEDAHAHGHSHGAGGHGHSHSRAPSRGRSRRGSVGSMAASRVHSHGGSPQAGVMDPHASRPLPSRSAAGGGRPPNHFATMPSPGGARRRALSPMPGAIGEDSADHAPSALISGGGGLDDPPVPVDQMSLITKALAESGVQDMAAFLRKLAAKPRAAPRTSYGTTTCDELPSWFLAYPNVINGYRVNFTAQMCLQSLFKLHNETLNVWTEFLPALGFFVAFFVILSQDEVLLAASAADRAFVAVGLFGAQVVRPIASGLAHLMYPQNERAYVLWWGIDYASICLSIFCTCAVFGRFAFYCLPDQQSFFYVSLAGLFLSTIVAVLFVSSNAVRTGSFLLFVLFSTGVPLWYTLGLKWAGGAADDVPEAYVMLWLVSLGCFGVGLGFKSSGFPESLSCGGCIKPGTFDVWGGSHANWHLCINAGNALVYPVWRQYLKWRLENTCHH